MRRLSSLLLFWCAFRLNGVGVLASVLGLVSLDALWRFAVLTHGKVPVTCELDADAVAGEVLPRTGKL